MLPQIFVGLKGAVSLAVIAEIANPDQGLGAVIVLVERLTLPWARDITG